MRSSSIQLDAYFRMHTMIDSLAKCTLILTSRLPSAFLFLRHFPLECKSRVRPCNVSGFNGNVGRWFARFRTEINHRSSVFFTVTSCSRVHYSRKPIGRRPQPFHPMTISYNIMAISYHWNNYRAAWAGKWRLNCIISKGAAKPGAGGLSKEFTSANGARIVYIELAFQISANFQLLFGPASPFVPLPF